MNRLLMLGLPLLLLGGCVDLPGENSGSLTRYNLQGAATHICKASSATLELSVTQLGAGLDSDRIARRDAASGEVTYLQGVRWVDSVGPMVEQRLAADLECAGYAVVTSHHRKLAHDRLVCEVRALNLVASGGDDQAEVGLSCLLFGAADKSELALASYQQWPLQQWRADQAVAALNSAYQAVFAELLAALE